MPPFGDENVGGLDVPVNNACRVSRVESVSDFDCLCEKLLNFRRTPADSMLQRHAIEKLHGDERMTGMFADLIDGADVGMIQRGRRARFTAKALQGLGVLLQMIGQEFQGHEAAQFDILSFVDHTHAPTAELLDDAIMRDGLADHRSRMLRP
jgi:hypothetical protein